MTVAAHNFACSGQSPIKQLFGHNRTRTRTPAPPVPYSRSNQLIRRQMPLIAHALFYFAYAMSALAVASALLRLLGAGVIEACLAGLCLFAVLAVSHVGFFVANAHGVLKGLEQKLRGEIEGARAEHKVLRRDVGALTARVDEMDAAFTEAVLREAALPAPHAPAALEGKMLDQLADRLGKVMDARIDDMRRALPFSSSAPRRPQDLVREALTEGRVELHLQPIVTLPQRRPLFYEGFTRLKDPTGRVVMPDEFLAPAEAAGLMPQIDNMLLFRCVQIVRKLLQKDRRVGVFCNLSPRSLSDEVFFPNFVEFLQENRDLAGAMLFEIPQAAFEARTPAQARAMARLADLGFGFSLDRVHTLALDLADLERSAVRFVKVDGAVLVRQLNAEHVRPRGPITREIAAADVASVFRRHMIELIAERIEQESVVVEVLDLDIALAQGNLFGSARPIKDKLMAETAPPPGYLGDRSVG